MGLHSTEENSPNFYQLDMEMMCYRKYFLCLRKEIAGVNYGLSYIFFKYIMAIKRKVRVAS